MKKLLRSISIVLIIANLLMIPFSSYANGTTSTTSDNALLSKWKGLGLLDATMTNSDLSKPITKIDFISFINDILKPSKQVDIGFNDVPKDSWYGAEIAKAVAAGYVTNQDKTNYNPFDNITRLDAAVMVANVFELELKDKTSINRITDTENLETDQLASLGAVIEKGYLTEISVGRYAPTGVLKLIDAMQMLDKCFGQLVTKSSTITRDVPGNMLINTNSVTLEKITVNGDLIIGEGVADGEVRIENTILKGRLIVRGGGPNSVILINTKVNDDLIVEKSAGDVHVELFGTSVIEQTYLKSGCLLSEKNLSGKGFVNVTANQAAIDNQNANLQGDFNNIVVDDSNINIKLNGNAQNINISKDTKGSFSVNGNVDTIATQASQNTLELLGGTISKLNVETGAKGNKITINGAKTNAVNIATINLKENTAVNIDKGTVEELTIESSAEGSNLQVKSGAILKNFYAKASATITGKGQISNAYVYSQNVSMGIKPSGTYLTDNSATDTDGTVADSNSSIKVYGKDITIQVGKTAKVTAFVVPTSSILSYSSLDNTIAAVDDKGMLTANSVGTTSVYISAQKDGYTSNVATITVTVTSDNISLPGALEISPTTKETGICQDFTLTYTVGDNMQNGKVVISLPAGFSVSESDTVSIGSKSATEKTLEQSQRPDSQTLLFTNLNLTKDDTIVVKLKNKVVPAAGQYEFSATSDADGTGPKLQTSDGKAIFTSDSLRELIKDLNYSGPELGSTGGTTKLTIKGFNGATKWFIKVQDGAFTTETAPKYDDILLVSPTEYFEYKSEDDIPVVVGQHLRLVAVNDKDGTNKIKAYSKDIVITDAMIRQYDAGKLQLGTDYNAPAPGIQAYTTRIGGLDVAKHWMIKVQDSALSTVFVNTKFEGATNYTSGDDIQVNVNQHIILAAVDSNGKILAYTDIQIENNMISIEAKKLVAGNNSDSNLSIPTYGSLKGTTKIETLNKGNFEIDKWMIVLLGKEAIKPALNAPVDQYQKYTKNSDGSDNDFVEYIADSNIPALSGQHLLLVGVKGNNIKAYADLPLDGSTQIRQASAPGIPPDNIGAVVMGSEQFTTKIKTLSLTGSAILVDAEKFMVKVQNEKLEDPQINSTLTGASDYTANTNIKDVSEGKIIVLLATDRSGRIKAFYNITIGKNQIRPANALLLKNPTDYQFVAANTTLGATKIISLPAGGPNGVTDFREWRYKILTTAFEVPYLGSNVKDTIAYTPDSEIKNVSENQHILLIAVDSIGGTLAYADETLNIEEIKQPLAEKLNSSADVVKDFNYSIPEPGLKGGQTKIAKLYLGDIVGANKWFYKKSSTAIATLEKNSTLSGLSPYFEGTSIDVKEGDKYFILFAVDGDNNNRIKKYACIELKPEYISLPVLKSPDNYTISVGSTAGTTNLKDLKFTGATKWMYAVGNVAFTVPAQGTKVSLLSYKDELTELSSVTTTAAIGINANQYIMLLAVDDIGLIKGYANIQVLQGQIKPSDAPIITESEYTLEKGSAEGTTRFSKLVDLTKFSGATQWMIYVQSGAFTTPIGKDTTVSAAKIYYYSETQKPDIAVNANGHILLLATDSSGKVKAYKDIEVDPGLIQTPFAKPLENTTTNYTGPRVGTSEGTTNFTISDANVPDKGTGTIVWKYKTGTQQLAVPHYNDGATSYAERDINGDFVVQPNNWLLVVATIDNKVKAYFQLQIGSSSIKPKEAPKLVVGKNYKGLIAGSEPGTTKIDGLDPIDLSADFAGWAVKASTTAEPLILNNYFGTPSLSIGNIKIRMEKYIVLAAVNKSGNVIAYANIEITNGSQISPSGFDNNYSGPQIGSVKGTTCFDVSLNGLDGADGFVARVVDSPVSLTAGEEITLGTGTLTDFSNYREYSALTNIAVNPNQHVVLIAVAANKVVAYANIKIPETSINAGNAIILQPTKNYKLESGTSAGTVKFTNFSAFGVPGFDNKKWIVKFVDTPIDTPILNTVFENAPAGYVPGSDLVVTQGKYIVLYAVDSTNAIKGYACIQVRPDPLTVSQPVPGTEYFTTRIDTAITVPAGTTLKYIIQKSSAGVILKDVKITDLTTGLITVYQPGDNISATENDYLLFAAVDNAVDNKDCIKAYKEIKVTEAMLRIPNTTATLSGTLITTTATDIVNGGKTLIITLNDGKWESDIATTLSSKLYMGLKTSTDTGALDNVITELNNAGEFTVSKPYGIERTSDTVVTITFPKVSATNYKITKSQSVTVTIDASCIIGDKSVTAPQKITIATVAVPVPTKITKVSGPTGTYKQDDIIPISVEFEEVVEIANGVTPPYITLPTGSSKRNIYYSSGSGTNTLVFNYTVQAGDYSSDLTYSSTSLSPTNSIKNKSTGNPVTLTLPSATASNALSACDIVVDTVAPKFVTTPTQNTATKAEITGDVLFKINETGKVYYVAMADTGSTTMPTVQQVLDWNTSPSALVIAHGVVNAEANVAGTITIGGLSPNTKYIVYLVAEDALANRAATLAKCSVQTIDKTPPAFTVTNVTPSDYSVSVVVNTNEIGNIYAVAKLHGASAPTNSVITSSKFKATVDSTNVNKDITINVTGLTVSTDYDIYVACNDKAATPNLSAINMVQAKTKPLDLTKVDVDLAKNLLLNTNTLMDYSLDGVNWVIKCGSPTTGVKFNYTDDTDYVYVYIREHSNPANPIQTIILGKENESIITTSKIDYDISKKIINNNSDINLQYRLSTDVGTPLTVWKALPANGQAKDVEFVAGGVLYLRTAVTSPTAAGKDSKLPSKEIEFDGILGGGEAPALTVNDTANRINGLQSIHQYSVNGGGWTSGELAKPEDFAGTKTVLVRFKATASQLASEEQELKFTANTLKVTAAPATSTSKATVAVVFEENTNKAGQTLTAKQIKDWFKVGTTAGVQHEWGTDIQGKFVSANTLTITFNSAAGSTIKIGDVVEVTTAAAIQNSGNTSGVYTSTGILAGTVPKIKTIKAVYVSKEKLIITFDQATNKKNITSANIANYLILTDLTGKTKKWSKTGTPDISFDWTSDSVLTITINNFSDTELAVGEKIRVSPTWGLTDPTGTSDACTWTQAITGSFAP